MNERLEYPEERGPEAADNASRRENKERHASVMLHCAAAALHPHCIRSSLPEHRPLLTYHAASGHMRHRYNTTAENRFSSSRWQRELEGTKNTIPPHLRTSNGLSSLCPIGRLDGVAMRSRMMTPLASCCHRNRQVPQDFKSLGAAFALRILPLASIRAQSKPTQSWAVEPSQSHSA